MARTRRNRPPALAAALGALSLSLTACASTADTSAACDRDCLAELMTAYVEALAAHDPARLPLAADVRFTENAQERALGEGLWTSITGVGAFRHDYLDTRAQVAASHLHLTEGDTQVLLAAVLHVEDRQIAGIETLVQRVTPEGRFQPTELGGPIRGLDDPVPADARMSRAAMIATALTYTEGLRIGDFTAGGTPFAPETYRVENGVITAGPGCGRDDCGMYAQRIILHPDIEASVAAVDEENAAVLLWMNFGFTNSYGEGNALVTLEAFKVWGGEIHAVQAFFPILPMETERGWPSTDPAPEWRLTAAPAAP